MLSSKGDWKRTGWYSLEGSILNRLISPWGVDIEQVDISSLGRRYWTGWYIPFGASILNRLISPLHYSHYIHELQTQKKIYISNLGTKQLSEQNTKYWYKSLQLIWLNKTYYFLVGIKENGASIGSGIKRFVTTEK